MATVYFITATDTNVGKTVVCAHLAAQAQHTGQQVVVYKPIQTGSADVTQPEDPCRVAAWLNAQPPNRWSTEPLLRADDFPAIGYTYSFIPPVTPAVADTQGEIDAANIVRIAQSLANQSDCLLIEGAGGLMAPISGTLDMLGLMRQLYAQLPQMQIIVVARPDLGTINHTRMTLACLTGLPVAKVIVSGYPEHTDDPAIQSLPQVFKHWLTVPVSYLPIISPVIATPSPRLDLPQQPLSPIAAE